MRRIQESAFVFLSVIPEGNLLFSQLCHSEPKAKNLLFVFAFACLSVIPAGRLLSHRRTP
jgi:hypothetical protein